MQEMRGNFLMGKYKENISLNVFWRELREIDTYFYSCHRHQTSSCLTFDAGRHLNRCDAADDCGSSAAYEELAEVPC